MIPLSPRQSRGKIGAAALHRLRRSGARRSLLAPKPRTRASGSASVQTRGATRAVLAASARAAKNPAGM
jgi:hypothetical protein